MLTRRQKGANSCMELYEIVMTLNGPVQPTGEHNCDQGRLQNMNNLTELIDKLMLEVHIAAKSANRTAHSVKEIGASALEYLASVRDGLVETVEPATTEVIDHG